MKAVIVTWHDAHAGGTWVSEGEIDDDPYVVKSVGWLVENVKPGHFTLAQSAGHGNVWDNLLHIPNAMVVRVQAATLIPVKKPV